MVTVNSLPQVEQALPNANYLTAQASPETAGAGVARAVGRLGAGLEDAALKIKAEDDTRAVMDAELALGNWEQTNLNDPNNGYFSKKGNNAIGGIKTISQGYQQTAGEIRAGLGNEEQRLAFDKIFTNRRESVLERVSRHEQVQRQAAMVDTQNAMMKQALENAMANYTDTKAIGDNINQGIRAITSVGYMNGDSKIVIGEKGKAFTSTVHRGVISRMMDDNPGAAKMYFEANKKQMLATDIEAISGPLDTQSTKQNAKATSERIFAEGGTPDEMYRKAREIQDVDLSDQTLQRLKVMQSEREQAKVDQANNAWSNLAQNPSFDAIPAGISGKEQAAMRSYVEKRLSGNPAKTDLGYYNELISMTPDDLRKQELDFNRLSEKDATFFMRRRNPAQTGGGGGVDVTDNIANQLLAKAGITDPKDKGAFKVRLREEAESAKAMKGGKLSYDEIVKLSDKLIMQTGSGGWFSGKDYNFNRTIDGVPNAAVADIANALDMANLPADPETIAKAYTFVNENRDDIVDALVARGLPVNYNNILTNAISTMKKEGK